MPRTRPILNTFNSGELTPLLDGRVDQDKYFSGAKTLLNFIPTVQGPARRRGGTRFVGVVKNSLNRTWLSDFSFSLGQSYILEWGEYYLRFWVNRGQLLSVGVPYEIATPYGAADLITAEGTFALRFATSGDVTWIVHAEGKFFPRRLSRLGATNWTITPDPLDSGPFRDINQDAGIRVQATAPIGSGVGIISVDGVPLFQPGHVGSLFMIESMVPNVRAPFQTTATYTVGDQIRNAGNVYQAQNSGGSTTAQRYPPTHTEGDANDGVITWRYLHSGYGWLRINSVAPDGLSASGDVLQRIPDDVTTGPSRRWAFSEFSSIYGYPSTVGFFRERLVYTRGRTAFLSVVGDFNNFRRRDAGLVTKETAVVLTLSADKFDAIRWQSQSKALVFGTDRNEMALAEQTSQSVFAADNAQNTPQTDYGSRLIRPLRAGDSVLFVERAGHRIRDMRFSFETDRYKAEDLTVLSEHLFDGSEIEGEAARGPREVVDWAYQQQRDNLVWCVLSDGTIAGLVLNRERGVIAWSPHTIGGEAFVEAVQCIPSPDGRTDDVWLIVRRTIGGVVQRAVEYVVDYRQVKLGVAEAFHVDCGRTYRGAPTTVITGLAHLEGRIVDILADGALHPRQTVVGGQITLQSPASLVHVGYGFPSRFRSMRLEVQGGGGTSQTARKGFASVHFRFQSTVGGRFGPSFNRMDPIKTVPVGTPMNAAPVLFNGDVDVDWNAGWNTDGYLCYEQANPHPATLVALVLRAQIND